MKDRVSPAPDAQPSAANPRRRRIARPVSEADVLAAVIELSSDYHAPSTSLIIWRLAGDGTVTSAFQSAVRDALERLRVHGRLSCVVHRGTHHWSATRDSRQPPA
jgi:hypothetical protein